jgi:hypothetical protein
VVKCSVFKSLATDHRSKPERYQAEHRDGRKREDASEGSRYSSGHRLIVGRERVKRWERRPVGPVCGNVTREGALSVDI